MPVPRAGGEGQYFVFNSRDNTCINDRVFQAEINKVVPSFARVDVDAVYDRADLYFMSRENIVPVDAAVRDQINTGMLPVVIGAFIIA